MSSIEDIVSSIVIPPSQNLNLDEISDVLNERNGLTKQLEVLTSQLQSDTKSLKDKMSSLEKERVQVRKDVTKLKEDDAVMTAKIAKFKNEIKDVQYKVNKTNQISCITLKEQKILEQNQKELSAYKATTGIRWNFEVPDNILEGLITNSLKNFVKTFSFDKSTSNKKLRESLWSTIIEAGSESWNDLDDDKENHAK